MKHKVHDLTGIVPDNGPIQIDGLDLLQNGEKIGSMDDETLDYLVENRKNLQILKFIEPQVTREGQLVDVKLFSTLKTDLIEGKQFSVLKVIYYGLVIIASSIFLLYTIVYGTVWWIYLFLGLTLLSGIVLLYSYLKEHGRLDKNE
ncbi:MAG TPA: hypothetical protein GX703_02240 [Erysipelothrix sp.]|jgi:hypothetical protein|nr:hypothetical protein [Erysipelothrix sp.]